MANARPWDDIEAHYLDLISRGWNHHRLLGLVTHIKSSKLGERLYGCTSLDKLIISIYDPIEWNREALHIEFDRNNQSWHFKYRSRSDVKPELEKQYGADEGLEKFDKFISMVKW